MFRVGPKSVPTMQVLIFGWSCAQADNSPVGSGDIQADREIRAPGPPKTPEQLGPPPERLGAT